jgi:hypothetical protein
LTYLMCVFIVYWCFLFVCFSIEPTASHFNIYCLHFCQSRSKYYLRTKFQDGIDKPQKCQNVCYHPTYQQQSDFLILVLYCSEHSVFIDVFIVNWCFLFVCFSIEPTASHFNIYCLHFCLISSVSYDEWRIKTVFIMSWSSDYTIMAMVQWSHL